MVNIVKPRIVVTMTSWKKRILTTHIIIQQFLANQTIKPDKFILWLSTDEFQNKENDLPLDLIQLQNFYSIFQIRWINGNDYCYKRWNVYPEYWNDYVISIDDDSYHSPTLIEDSLSELAKFKDIPCVCNIWWQFSAIPTFQNDISIHFVYPQTPIDQRIWTCATTVIPPRIFPLEALNDEITEFRRKYLPVNDESWLIPFMLKNDIQTTFIKRHFPYQTISNEKETSLSRENAKKRDKYGYSNTEKTLYIMLKKLELIEKFTVYHPRYSPICYESLIQENLYEV